VTNSVGSKRVRIEEGRSAGIEDDMIKDHLWEY
jgi:hypothetical protein